MFAPESLDRINQEIIRDRRQRDAGCDCCVELCDVLSNEGYGACDKKGIDSGHLVVERVFHAFWGKEYEDSWREGRYSRRHKILYGPSDLLKQDAVT